VSRLQRFTKRLTGLNNYTYDSERLHRLYLELRRLCSEILYGVTGVVLLDLLNCADNIPVTLLVLHSSLNVQFTFGTVCLLTQTFRHFQLLFNRQTGWIFSSLDVLGLP